MTRGRKRGSVIGVTVVLLMLAAPLPALAGWEKPKRLSNNDGYSDLQQIAVWDTDVHVVWRDDTGGDEDVYYRRSTDGGATWQPVEIIADKPIDEGNASIAVQGKVVHVVWEDYSTPNPDIVYRRSIDGGETWQAPVRLTKTPDASWSPVVAASGGRVHIVWIEAQTGADKVFHKKSLDGGSSWSKRTRLSSLMRDAGGPVVAVAGKSVHVAWHEDFAGNDDVMYRRSINSGKHWQARQRLSKAPGWSAEVALTVYGAALVLAWTDMRSGDLRTLYRRSTDGGVTWSKTRRLDETTDRASDPSVTIVGKKVHAAWSDRGPGPVEVFYRRSTDRGKTWDPPVRITSTLGYSYEPDTAVFGPVVHLVWNDDSPGNNEIYYRRRT